MSATTSPRALAAAAPPLDGALGGPLAPLALPAAALAAASAASAAAGGGAGEKARRRHTTGLNPDDGYASAVAAPTLARDDALPRPPRSRMGSTAGGVDTRIGIERLPWEVLVEIFSYLDLRSVVQGAQVSRRWRAIAADNWLWQQVRGPATRPPCRIHALPHRRPVPWAHVTSGRGMRAGGRQLYRRKRWRVPAQLPAARAVSWHFLFREQARLRKYWRTNTAEFRSIHTSSVGCVFWWWGGSANVRTG